MKLLSIFNNKGGVGKTTLTFHLAHALAELGKRVLIMDLDPQCNLTIFSLSEREIADIWREEDDFIEDFKAARGKKNPRSFDAMTNKSRSIHFILKPIEDGTEELKSYPPPVKISENLDIIPGRLTLHTYEGKLAERFSGVYSGDPLSIRTTTAIRSLAHEYARKNNYDIVILDTSPSLGALNRSILSQADAFLIPANADLFSLYGIRNIGSSLKIWKKQFESVFSLLSDAKRSSFPKKFVTYLGYTLYNTRKLQGSRSTNPLGLAHAHYNYAKVIPDVIFESIPIEDRVRLSEDELKGSLANGAAMYSHNTQLNLSQKYHKPIWALPDLSNLDKSDSNTITVNRNNYSQTRQMYHEVARDVIRRLSLI